MKLTERIRLIREEYEFTQEDIAEKSNISSSAYGQIERNAMKASLQTLQKVAEAIGVPLIFLLDTSLKQLKK